MICSDFVTLQRLENFGSRLNNKLMTKLMLNAAVKELPNEFSIDDLIEKLILVESFEQGKSALFKINRV